MPHNEAPGRPEREQVFFVNRTGKQRGQDAAIDAPAIPGVIMVRGLLLMIKENGK